MGTVLFMVNAKLSDDAAGAGIADRVHFHIVPRWTGDTNFMLVLAEVKVMPEYLQTTLRQLREQDHDGLREQDHDQFEGATH